jgi:predicted dithiol-disulfide oxidoreductase (DUF899 family)
LKSLPNDDALGRSQLLVYHIMFGPEYTAGCPACSAIADGFDGFVVHLANHDVTLGVVSRAPLEKLQGYKRRMGWSFPCNIIAAIIDTHRATMNANEPSSVAAPMSIRFVCRTTRNQDAAASPRVAASAAAVAAVLALVMAGRRRVRPELIEQPGSRST